ncbi:ycf2-A Protein [Nymphaea thermarum]|nr:ycf2-A Protein [Nymphaea thermarum]
MTIMKYMINQHLLNVKNSQKKWFDPPNSRTEKSMNQDPNAYRYIWSNGSKKFHEHLKHLEHFISEQKNHFRMTQCLEEFESDGGCIYKGDNMPSFHSLESYHFCPLYKWSCKSLSLFPTLEKKKKELEKKKKKLSKERKGLARRYEDRPFPAPLPGVIDPRAMLIIDAFRFNLNIFFILYAL